MKNIQGFVNDDERLKLQDWASKYDSVVEVGSWKGRSTSALCEACKGKVYAVDHFKGSPSESDGTNPIYKLTTDNLYEIFMENMKDYHNLEVLKMGSLEAAKLFEPRSMDMVFLDASHEYEDIKADLAAWAPIAKKWLCGHDLYMGGVKRALDEAGIRYRSVGFRFPWCLWYSEVQA